MKKVLIYFCTVIIIFLSSGCTRANTEKSDRLNIVTATFPQYDWVREILGSKLESFDVTLLTKSGVELHSFTPSAADMVKISDSNLFLYLGSASDEWAKEIVRNPQNPDLISLAMVDSVKDSLLSLDSEQVIVSDDHSDKHEHGHSQTDEHIWLSIKNAKIIFSDICDAICKLDPQNAEYYRKNEAAYLEKLDEQDRKYSEAVENAKRKTVMFADRFAFRYLFNDYSLTCYAAFSGCSSDSEVGFETVTFLSNTLDSLSLPCVMVLEGSDERLAKTVVENTKEKKCPVLKLNSLQSVAIEKIQEDFCYLSVMQDNLETLEIALN